MGANIGNVGVFSSSAQSGVPNLDVSSSTGATVSVGANNDYYKADASSNAQVFILPNPSTNKGKQITIEKVDTTLNVVTLYDGGSNVTTANTNGEAVQVVSDGASYQIINRRIPSQWQSNLTFTPDATAFGTPTGITFMWRREGDCMAVRGYFVAGTVTANPIKVSLPTGVTASSSKLIGVGGMTPLGMFYCNGNAAFAAALLYNNGSSRSWGPVTINSASLAMVYFAHGGESLLVGAFNANSVLNNGDAVMMDFKFPVEGWNG